MGSNNKKTTTETETVNTSSSSINKKYITLDEGTDFRRIAEVMTGSGFSMNHATARNQLMLALENLLANVMRQMNVKLDKKHMDDMLRSQEVHNALADVLHSAYTSLKAEGKL